MCNCINRNASRSAELHYPRNSGVCHTTLRRCNLLTLRRRMSHTANRHTKLHNLRFVGAYGIRPVCNCINRNASRSAELHYPRNSGVCHTPLRRCNLLTLRRRMSHTANRHTKLHNLWFVGAYGIRPVPRRMGCNAMCCCVNAIPRNSGVCHTTLRRCFFMINCLLCNHMAH